MPCLPSPLEKLSDPLFEEKGVELFLKRDDLIHPYVMGNKWRKLKYNLRYARENGFEGILTVGGAYSNHIAATAAACRENDLKSIGIIRGEELNEQSNPTLRFAKSQNMQLKFVTRDLFRKIKANLDALQQQHPRYYCLPEGGTNSLAIEGCAELVKEIKIPFDYLTTAVGTGGTLAGVVKGLEGNRKVLGFSALKGDFVRKEFEKLKAEQKIEWTNHEIITRFHFGGYGKVCDQLIAFINAEKTATGILLDPIYTAKMYFGLKTLIAENYFAPGTCIIAIHTGGLQGIEGSNSRSQKKIMA